MFDRFPPKRLKNLPYGRYENAYHIDVKNKVYVTLKKKSNLRFTFLIPVNFLNLSLKRHHTPIKIPLILLYGTVSALPIIFGW